MAADGAGTTALLALDWGSSTLRGARLASDGQVLEQRTLGGGVLQVATGGFAAAFASAFGDWAHGGARACLIAGMAGSRQGWVETAYCPCPAGFADLAGRLHWLDDPVLSLPTAIVPGLCCELPCALAQLPALPEVMRGEEVQIFGAMQRAGWDEGLYILPGTHSKWAWVRDGRITHFQTAMSGEMFALLSRHSMLAHSIDTAAPFDADAFMLGVARARQGHGLLHNAFGTRTLGLSARMQPGPLASFLSGLVIGDELHHAPLEAASKLMLVGSPALTRRYAMALQARGIDARCMGDEAAWGGLHALARLLPPA